MHWARATGFKNKKKHCVMAVPVLYPSPQYELESSASPRIVTTPPTTVHRSVFTTVEARRGSSRTHAKTDIKVSETRMIAR
ncbi:hypothetical protein MRX96_054715 [Rhipicephalus microplus]